MTLLVMLINFLFFVLGIGLSTYLALLLIDYFNESN